MANAFKQEDGIMVPLDIDVIDSALRAIIQRKLELPNVKVSTLAKEIGISTVSLFAFANKAAHIRDLKLTELIRIAEYTGYEIEFSITPNTSKNKV